MFAFKPWTESVIRVTLIVAFVFSTTGPSAVVAQGREESIPTIKSNSQSIREDGHSIPMFERPTPRLGEPNSSDFVPSVKNNSQAYTSTSSNIEPSLLFIENVGQFDSHAQFQVTGGEATLFLETDVIWFSYVEPAKRESNLKSFDPIQLQQSQTQRRGLNLRVEFPGSNQHTQLIPFDKVSTRLSYFSGQDDADWQKEVPAYRGVRYVDFYPGMDLELASQGNQLTWRFVLTDPVRFYTKNNVIASQGIRVKLAGQKEIALDQENMQITTDIGQFHLPKFIFNSKQKLPTQLNGSELRIIVPEKSSLQSEPALNLNTDRSSVSKALYAPAYSNLFDSDTPIFSVDEALIYSTYLGGATWQEGMDIAVDTNGAAYITGYGSVFSVPSVPGLSNVGGVTDIFVAKFNPTGSQLEYLSFIGGGDYDDSRGGIAVDSSGNAYVTGLTQSNNFPVTPSAYDPTFNGGQDTYIFKLDASGTALVYSTYIGGSGSNETSYGIAVDSTGAVYIGGNTFGTNTSNNFPTTPGAFRGSNFVQGWEGFVLKMNPDGQTLGYSTLFGGQKEDYIMDIDIDNLGNAYVTGYTFSQDLPTTAGAYDQVMNCVLWFGQLQCRYEAFITKIGATGSLIYSTFLGGSSNDQGSGISVGNDGSAYVTGQTTTWFNGNTYFRDFPLTSQAFQRTLSDEEGGFVSRLSPTGSSLLYSTYIGGNDTDWMAKILVDNSDNIFVLGWTYSTVFPLVLGAFDRVADPDFSDLIIAKIGPSGSLVYGSFFGSPDSGENNFMGAAIDDSGHIFITGATYSSAFPTTAGSFSTTHGGTGDAFVSKLSTNLPAIYSDMIMSSCGPDCFINPTTSATNAYVGGPINTQTGAYDYSSIDLSLPTTVGELFFQRTYSSQAITKHDLLGPGWTHNHDIRLIFPNSPLGVDGQVLFKAHTANIYKFYDMGDGTYNPHPGLTASLTRTSVSPLRYEVKDTTDSVFVFDETGKLLTYSNPEGQTWDYTYETNGKLDRVIADGGFTFLDLAYDPQNGQLTSVSDQTGRSVVYEYDPNGNLEIVLDVLGQPWTHKYEDQPHLLTKVEAPGSVTVERIEYEQGRAVRQYNGEGKLVVEITPNADGTITIKDALTNEITHTYDERGTLLTDETETGAKQKKEYDFNLRPGIITDPLNNPTLLEWSDDGSNLEYIKDALDGETFIFYENANSPSSPTKITDSLGHDRTYFYTNTDFPSLPTRIEYPLSFDNGNTFVGTDYDYYPPLAGASAGKVKLVTDTLGHQTRYTYTPSGQIETVSVAFETTTPQTTSYSYDEVGNLTRITDPEGHITENQYDDAGRLTKTVRNPHPTNSQRNFQDQFNITTDYFYDARDNQIAVVDTLWKITRTYYDLANRPIHVVQNLVINATPATSYAGVAAAINATNAPTYDPNHPDWNIQTKTVYDDAGNVFETHDRLGNITQNSYDQANRLVLSIQNFTGTGLYSPANPDENIHTEYEYDLNDNLIARRDTLGVITRIYYDKLNRPFAAVEHLTGQDISVEIPPSRGSSSNIRSDTFYDANGNIIATQDPNGVLTRTYYDALSRPVALVKNLVGKPYTDPTLPDPQQGECGTEDNICSFTYYDEAGRVIATVDPNGVVTRTYYDLWNRAATIVRNLVGQSIYDPNPPAFGSANPDENVRTDYGHNENNQIVDVLDSLERQTHYAFDQLGQLTKETVNYTNGGTPQNYRDASGNQFNLITTYTYDVRGNQIAVTDTTGVTTRTYYDALARPISVVWNLTVPITNPSPPARTNPPNPLANLRTDTLYLANGNIDSVMDEMAKKTEYSYDMLGRLTSGSDPLLNTTSFEYDGNGNRTLMTDAELVVTKYEYDDLNNLKTVIENYDPNPAVPADVETKVRTDYTYDANGNLISIRDGNSNLEGVDYRTMFSYDRIGRLKTETDPLGNAIAYQYDANDNLTRQTDAIGQRACLYYDALNRLIGKHYRNDDNCPANPTYDATFNYDALGRRTNMGEGPGGVGPTTWEYNNLDLPMLITDPFGTEISYDYDALGNRTNLNYGSQAMVYEYNDLNQLFHVTGGGLSSEVEYGYDAVGRLTTVNRPGAVNSLYHYFDNGWLQDITHTSGSTTLASYEYEYYNNGNRQQAIENILFPSLPPTLTPTSTSSSTSTPSLTPGGPTVTPSRTNTPTFTPTSTSSPTSSPTNTASSGSSFVVTKTNDTNDGTCNADCSLREAVRAANATAGADTIIIPPGTYTLTITGADATAAKGDLDITESVIVIGQGNATNTIVAAGSGWSDRIFDVIAGNVSLSNVTIQGGNLTSSSGGGIKSVNSSLSLSHVVVSGNQTTVSGGGVFVQGGSLVLNDSAVINNTAGQGGGILNDSATVTVTNVTVSANSAVDSGGGMRVTNTGTLSLMNVTVTNNTADTDSNNTGDGGGVFYSAGTFTFKNTIIAGNFDASTTTKRPDCSGAIQSLGHNIIGDNTGCTVTATTGDQFGTSTSPINPQLGLLQDNGGNTQTHALLSGSPAINAGDNVGCPATDQRGTSRDASCDMGAYEFIGSPPATSTPTNTATNTPSGPTVTPSRTFTPSFTPTQTPTSTGTSTSTFTPTSTNDLIFADGFETGNLSAWTSNTPDNGDLSVSTAAALKGTYGLQTVIDDNNSIFVTDDTPAAEPRYRARFYFDPNSITMASGDAFFIFKGYTGTSTDVLRMEVRNSSGAYQLRGGLLTDGSVWTNTNWFTITDASHSMEVDWRAASAAGANDGALTLWIDGNQLADLTGVDNDTWRIDRDRLGAISGVDTGTRGTYYLDAFESRRTSYIGPLAQAPSGQYAYARLAPAQQGGELTFNPTADAYLDNSLPTSNFGSATSLQVDNSPVRHFLLKFSVSGVNGQQVTNAKIRLFNTDSATIGGNFYRVADNTWQEGTVTWNNAPTADTTLLASLGAVSANTWYEVDVTSFVTGDGTYSVRVSSTSSNGADYSSKEAATNRPQLVITLGATATPTRTPTPTTTLTSSPTPVATNTSSRTPTATTVATNTNTPTVTLTPVNTPTFTPTGSLTPIPSGPITINYVYDPLNRLTQANYSNDDHYHYTYDAVGNRKTQQSLVGGLLTNDLYNYDHANRLSDVNGVLYDWDDNGNLLDDGVNAYHYDPANRLISFTSQGNSATYAYNGLGDRIQMIVNGQTTNFTTDFNTGLTQALSDGINNYVYGINRIAQTRSGTTEYFLGDALGSVRQLTNTSGALVNARAYAPYGSVTSTIGPSDSAYGYTNEYTSQGLLHLRARYYAPSIGRFVTRDTWEGDVNNPITFNRWQYANSNPIMYTDPSGHIACGDIIPSGRPIFEALGLCDPDEEPTGNPETIGTAQSLENWIYGNSIQCGMGYTPYGLTCVPIIVSDIQCGAKAPVIIPSVPSQWPVPGKLCQQLEGEHWLLMSQLAAKDLLIEALYDRLRDNHEPGKVKEIIRNLKRHLDERKKIATRIRIIKRDAVSKGCPNAREWPDPPPMLY
jgi:RHS repeat-associated protein/CSLREA domain-containing protein